MKNQRGQAMVELALGMVVLITVIAFGIHFAEVGYLSMRVQQAAAYAVYDATGQKAHEKGNKDLSSTVPGLVTSEVRKHFNDFEANQGAERARTPVRHVYTQVDNMQARCILQRSLQYEPLNAVVPMPFDGSRGGVQCGAEATINLTPGFPRNFFDGEWNLRERNYAGARDAYTVCATPRSANGNCGQFGVLVGDFSLQGKQESRSNDLFTKTNPVYHDLVEEAFDYPVTSSCPAALALSAVTAWSASLEACSFQFSYQGVEKNYRQNIRNVHAGSREWLTGGTNSRRTFETTGRYNHPLGIRRFNP